MGWNPFTWWQAGTYGTWVEVFLDYGFGKILPCTEPGALPKIERVRGRVGILYIPDLNPKKAAEALAGRRLDWHAVRHGMRAELELGEQVCKMDWKDIEPLLIEEGAR